MTISAKRVGKIYSDLTYLLSNAIKYNAHGGEIAMRLSPHEFRISNGDAGIDKVHQDRIFERYYRANGHEGGFGIGLNIVKRVCDRYDISITVESEENSLTEITLKF